MSLEHAPSALETRIMEFFQEYDVDEQAFTENIIHSDGHECTSIREMCGKFTDNTAVQFIAMSFTWSNTPEGHKYWSKLESIWRRRMSIIRTQKVFDF